MLEDGLSYPVRGDWIGRVIIGGVLGFFSWLILPAFLLMGYLVRVLGTTVAGVEEPPEFTDWGDLLMKGVIATVITLVYAIVPFFVYGVFVSLVIGTGGLIGGEAGGLLAGFGFLSLFAFIPVLFLVYYAVPAALTAYAVEEEAGAAFSVAKLKPTLLSVDYLVAMLMPIVVAVVLWILTGILAITLVGLLLVPFLQFYGQVAVFRMFGSAFGSVSEELDTPDAPGAPDTSDEPSF